MVSLPLRSSLYMDGMTTVKSILRLDKQELRPDSSDAAPLLAVRLKKLCTSHHQTDRVGTGTHPVRVNSDDAVLYRPI
jgi:hypothetical protein